MNDINPIIVIIATFNRENRLMNAVHSIIDQSHNDWRLIIIDDGSSDGTAEYLNSLTDSRIITYSLRQNAGVNKARNKAIDIIQEKNLKGYITLLDDDDIFHSKCFEELSAIVKSADTPNSQWYTANCIRTNGDKISKIKRYGFASYNYDYMYGKNIRGDLTHFISTNIINNIRFSTQFKNSEEWYFFCQIAKDYQLFSLDYDAKVVETLETGLLTSRVNKDKKIEVLKYKLKILEQFIPDKYTSLQTISLVNELAKSGRKSEARELLQSISFRNKLRYKYLLACLRSR